MSAERVPSEQNDVVPPTTHTDNAPSAPNTVAGQPMLETGNSSEAAETPLLASTHETPKATECSQNNNTPTLPSSDLPQQHLSSPSTGTPDRLPKRSREDDPSHEEDRTLTAPRTEDAAAGPDCNPAGISTHMVAAQSIAKSPSSANEHREDAADTQKEVEGEASGICTMSEEHQQEDTSAGSEGAVAARHSDAAATPSPELPPQVKCSITDTADGNYGETTSSGAA